MFQRYQSNVSMFQLETFQEDSVEGSVLEQRLTPLFQLLFYKDS